MFPGLQIPDSVTMPLTVKAGPHRFLGMLQSTRLLLLKKRLPGVVSRLRHLFAA